MLPTSSRWDPRCEPASPAEVAARHRLPPDEAAAVRSAML